MPPDTNRQFGADATQQGLDRRGLQAETLRDRRPPDAVLVDSPFRLRENKQHPVSDRKSMQQKPMPLFPTNLKARMAETEREFLQAGLQKARFNQKVAAELLGLSYDQLRGKIKKHKLDIG